MLAQQRKFLVLLHDTAMAFISIFLAFFLRLGDQILFQFQSVLLVAFLFSSISFFMYLNSGLYKHAWLYVSFSDGIKIVRSVSIIILLFVPLLFLFTRLQDIPRSVPVISWFILVVLLAAPRLAYRFIKEKKLSLYSINYKDQIPVIIVGMGKAGERFIRSTIGDTKNKYKVVGILANSKSEVGQLIHGIEVIGLSQDIEFIIDRLDIAGIRPNRIILGSDKFKPDEVKALLQVSQKTRCLLAKLAPDIDFHILGEKNVKPYPIDLEDLLGRNQLSLDRNAMFKLIRGKRVLVTGAGGSIGSELIRQIAQADPLHLSMIDNGEFNLYKIDNEVKDQWGYISSKSLIADVRDKERIEDIFNIEKPDIVFHAAALKHVPLVEFNPIEGLQTNSIGTRIIADTCLMFQVPEMVLISTDKAVNPVNVMGAAKRVAEKYCQAADISQNITRFITVRFGNVLGSAGSVVPLFQKQLLRGGPLTVTHPEVERYFMTVSEAVELVLQAAALGPKKEEKGAIYVLDMGKPIKIIDLARQVISLAGKTPDKDIKIKIVGLRPGEKITEELFYGEEPPITTGMNGIFIAKPKSCPLEEISNNMDILTNLCKEQNTSESLKVLKQIVPELIIDPVKDYISADRDSSHLKVIK